MKYEVEHGLADMAMVRKVVDAAFAHYSAEHPSHKPTFKWLDERKGEASFSILGRSLGATFEMTDTKVILDGKVPLLFKPFEDKALGVVKRELEAWLAKAKNGEL